MARLPVTPDDLMIAGTDKPDRVAVAAFLRSDEPITPEMRNWMADLFEATLQRGRPMLTALPHIEAVEYFKIQRESLARKRAIDATCEKFKLSRSTLESAIRRHRDAEDEHARLTFEETAHLQERARARIVSEK